MKGDSFDWYIRKAGEEPLLNAEEEKQLALQAQAGNLSARDRMFRANMRLTISIARQFVRGDNLEDLIQEGNLGLLHAIEKFDPEMETRFGTYATYWIKSYVSKAAKNGEQVIHVSQQLLTLRKSFRKQLPLYSSEEEAMDAMHLNQHQRANLKDSLHAVTVGINDDLKYGQELADRHSPSTTEVDDVESLHASLAHLPDRERRVMELRYGLQGDPQTLKQIAEGLGLSRARVQQLIEHGLAFLRGQMARA